MICISAGAAFRDDSDAASAANAAPVWRKSRRFWFVGTRKLYPRYCAVRGTDASVDSQSINNAHVFPPSERTPICSVSTGEGSEETLIFVLPKSRSAL